jgi:hypothetical protein
LPKSVGGSLYLSGCDLSTIDRFPEIIGGFLYLDNCDLSTITNLDRYRGRIIR